MTNLEIKLLGGFEVLLDGSPADFRTDALRVLLAYLASHQGRSLRRDTLAGLLSPDRPDKEALTYLRNRLTRLRQTVKDETAVPPWFDIDRKQITLRTGDDIMIDAAEFERLVATVESHPHRTLAGCPSCLADLQTAVDLVRGEFLAGLNFPSETWESWLLSQREHFQQRSLDAMGELLGARVELGDWEAVLALGQRQVRIEPWLEEAHRAIMQAYYHLGDRNGALSQYEACAAHLWDELGVEPEDETNDLHEQIARETLDVQVEAGSPNNLPLQTGLFFGRESEKALLLKRLVDPNYRLMTIVGPGGIGKTRLSLEVGNQVKTSYPDGVWFVPLDAVKGGEEQIKIAVGEALGLGQGDKQLSGDQVIAILRDKQTLLIFDNSESKLEDLAFMPEWLKRAPDLAILATSREPLNFQLESTVTLSGLPIGDEAQDEISAAEALFAERGQMARDDFEITADNLPHVREICDLVDGSPLGIGLAAAWVRRRSLAQIVQSIHKSLDFLSTRMRDIDQRHQSMRAVFETSWEMLTREEQAVLAALAVFPATFSAEAAEEITGGQFFDLDALCDKSLLNQQQEAERYSMHSLVRQFAAEKLGEKRPEVERGFVNYYFRFATLNREDYGELRPEWLNFIDGVRKASSLEAWRPLLDLVQVLDEPWFRQIRFTEMREGLSLALDGAKVLRDEKAFAQTLLRLGEIEMEQNDYDAAETHLLTSLELLMQQENSIGIANAKFFLGRINSEQTKNDVAIQLFNESINIFEDEEDALGIAKNLNTLAITHVVKDSNYEHARELLNRSIKLQQSIKISSAYSEGLRYLARINGFLGDFESAQTCLKKAIEICKDLEDLGEYTAVLFDISVLYRRQEKLDLSLENGLECLMLSRKIGSVRWEALAKTQLGILLQIKEDYPKALDYFQDSLQIYIETKDLFQEAFSHYYLFKVYKALGKDDLSNQAKQSAFALNKTLDNDYLQTLLQDSTE